MKITKYYLPGVLSALLLVGGLPASYAQESPSGRPGVSAMLQEVTPAVVNIVVTGSAPAQQQNPLLSDPRFREFFGIPEGQMPGAQPMMGAGSGVIIDAANGYVLTNHHVVENADKIEITLQDKRQVDAKLIGSDAGTDIALLQIQASNLKAIPRSDSDTLHVGDFVAAIGNPFGLGLTVTTGIVSALDRSGIGPAEGYEDFIQTDASINPGNSGGALVDYDGHLIGINSAIIAPAGGNVGIGFAVPINMAMSVVDQLIEFGEVRRGLLGVQITDLTPDVVEALDLNVAAGAVVSSVVPDSPAKKAGIEPGDVIIGVNGGSIVDGSDLRNTIALLREGTEVDIELVRGHDRMTVEAEIGGAKDTQTTAADSATEANDVLSGAQLAGGPNGVLVTDVEQGSRAFLNGLRPGDIVTAANRRPVTTPAALEGVVQESTGTVALNVEREGSQYFLIMR